ncbi:unnamed protein product [Sphagnum tenellum]
MHGIYDFQTSRLFSVTTVHGRTLELPRIMRSQMGKYLCIANNSYPPVVSRSAEIVVNFRPVISVPDPTVFAEEGVDLTIECMIEAYPKGIHYWETNQGRELDMQACTVENLINSKEPF